MWRRAWPSSPIPGAKQLVKIARAFPNAQAMHRHDVLNWHAEHQRPLRLTERQIRPHQALGYLTPNEFYAKWVAEQATATTKVSEMS